jgi:hypothetical protein
MKQLGTLAVLLALVLPAGAGEDAGKATGLSILVASADEKDAGKPAKLVGPDARLQLVVTAALPAGKFKDATWEAKVEAAPEGIVRIEAGGRLVPLKDGKTTLKATAQGHTASVEVSVERYVDPPPVSFANQVVPLFTKYGCNGGGCHGKSGGQNGFRLSLLGFEPPEDYEYLVQESFGRRILPSAPEHSLLLLKGAGIVPHGGGERIKKDGHDWRLLVRWVEQGMPFSRAATDPRVETLSVYPRHRVVSPTGEQQLRVMAKYTDGSVEDVTHVARYEPNDKDMAEVDEGGRVRLRGNPGDVAIMIRYQDRVAVFEAMVPLGAEVKELPAAKNVVDEAVFAKLKDLGLPPSAVCDDSTFLRRVTIDLAGRLPTAQEAKAFLDDKTADKRDRWIDMLLDSEAYADYFANKWASILRNKRDRETYQSGNYVFHEWIRTAIAENMPYDKFVRAILTASGEVSRNPTVAWYRQVAKDNEQVEDVAQLFLGVRIQCARCHHHPFEKWSQQDYYGLSAFFSRLGRKEGLAPDEPRVYHNRGMAQAQNPKTKSNVKPTGLGEPALEVSPEDDPRAMLADWMGRKDNPFFAKSLVNRYWKHFFGKGIVDPEDDMRETNPPSNKALLDGLAKRFVEKGFNLKDLVRTICTSNTYQFSSLPSAHNLKDKRSFSRYYPKRLNAEVLLDAIDTFNGTTTKFTGLPAGARAVQIPDHGGVDSYFLTVFGRPAGASACECERSIDASLAQSLHLLNSQDIHGKMSSGVAKDLAADAKKEDAEKLRELYYRAFSRPPTEHELKVAAAHVAKFEAGKKQAAYEDIVWALINTKEFLFNH